MIRAYENPLVSLHNAGYYTLISQGGYVRGGGSSINLPTAPNQSATKMSETTWDSLPIASVGRTDVFAYSFLSSKSTIHVGKT